MIKLIIISLLSILSLSAYAQNTNFGEPAAGSQALSDVFHYNGNTVGHYSLGWYYNQGLYNPPTAYLAGFSGINMFTEGQLRMLVSRAGHVGIGTNAPLSRLHVSTPQSADFSAAALRLEQPYTELSGANLLGPSALFSTNNGNTAWLLGAVAGTVGTPGNFGGYPGGLSFYTKAGDGNSVSLPLERMRIDQNGNVGVGTFSPDARLTVNGTVHAREVKVDLAFPAPDFVFEPKYRLPTLQEVERYVKLNRHLPEVPSAAELAAGGMQVGEMNLKLLQKVEEITLHLIAMQKENTTSKIQNRRIIQKQQQQIKALQQKIASLLQK
ncbi:hypothetical protein [Mucilaginibacter sp. PAMB04168]|uniref:hypothetical protein n=1 Tax=Mucilaginibacter sp. PAMB04168 TaxID=3138567 RepID=UPI0031F60789